MKRALFIIFVYFLMITVGCQNEQDNYKKENISTIKKTDSISSDGSINIYIYGNSDKVKTPNSSWIDYISYYKDSKHLIVHTKDGKTYVHANVTSSLWNSFKNTDSYGSYYANNLKGNKNYWVIGYDGDNGDKIHIHFEK